MGGHSKISPATLRFLGIQSFLGMSAISIISWYPAYQFYVFCLSFSYLCTFLSVFPQLFFFSFFFFLFWLGFILPFPLKRNYNRTHTHTHTQTDTFTFHQLAGAWLIHYQDKISFQSIKIIIFVLTFL